MTLPEEFAGAQCEWSECERDATVMHGEQGDFLVCRGHQIVMQANAATWGEFGIPAAEYKAEILRANDWFLANPNERGDDQRD